MGRQFLREYELTIHPKGSGEARVVTDLRIAFDVTKSVLSYPNLAKITIWNPNPTTIAALQSKYTRVSLSAGYKDAKRTIFKGEIRNSYTARKGTERQIIFFAGDGQRSWQNATFNRTFSENVTVEAAIKDIASSLEGIATGSIEGLPQIADKLRGQVLSGASKELLDSLADEYDFNWSIQDETFTVTPTSSPASGSTAVLVTPETGMIGSPTLTEIGADVTTLLNPEFQPDGLISIQSASANLSLGNLYFRELKKTSAEGFYKIQEVQFKGDSREGEWQSLVKGRSFNV